MARARHFVAMFPSALLLAVGYGYSAIILGFGFGIPPSSELHQYGWEFAVVSGIFALWHLAGYLGLVTDGPRKIGYLASGAWLGGFALLLYVDGSAPLAAGYIMAGCFVAIASYWKYPRRSEGG